jgi:hypothetical protein
VHRHILNRSTHAEQNHFDASQPSTARVNMEKTEVDTKERQPDAANDALPPPTYQEAVLQQGPSQSTAQRQASQPEKRFLPIAVPQTSTTIRDKRLFPFALAYAPSLAERGIVKEDFVAFIVGLNDAFVSPAALRILGTAGTAVGMLPIIMGIGMGVRQLTESAGAGVSQLRTKAYLKKSNMNLFIPAGLQAKVCTTPELMQILRERVRLSTNELPVSDDLNAETTTDAANARRLRALQGSVAPLDWDVSSSESGKSWLSKLDAWHAKKSGTSLGGSGSYDVGSNGRRREKDDDDSTASESDSDLDDSRYGRKVERVRQRADRRILRQPNDASNILARRDRRLARLEQRRSRSRMLGSSVSSSSMDKGKSRVDKREENLDQRLHWVVIVSLT